jgi:group II intron reverse transcriptase/maturase
MPQAALTTLAHHIDLDLLLEAYRRTRKDGAVGIDRQTAEEYAESLEENLRHLLERAKSGTYRAPPVRRARIPKGDGSKTRPIGIPTFEDKVLQRAVAMLLGAVYEQDFRDCSYGFRPERSAHQALQELWEGLMRVGGGWVLELDIEDFFGSLDHQRLREILRRRVRDGVLLRLIGKWLRAGVLEEGTPRRLRRDGRSRLKPRPARPGACVRFSQSPSERRDASSGSWQRPTVWASSRPPACRRSSC